MRIRKIGNLRIAPVCSVGGSEEWRVVAASRRPSADKWIMYFELHPQNMENWAKIKLALDSMTNNGESINLESFIEQKSGNYFALTMSCEDMPHDLEKILSSVGRKIRKAFFAQ